MKPMSTIVFTLVLFLCIVACSMFELPRILLIKYG